MDVQWTLVVKYLSWIIFHLVQKPSSAINVNFKHFIAPLSIKKGYNISLFDLEKLVGYECGSRDSWLHRDPNIDSKREVACPFTVLVCFPDCDNMHYSFEMQYPDLIGNLVTWMKKYLLGENNILSNVKGFDFVINKSSLTRAAVYNPGPPHVRPRIFAIPTGKGEEPISNIFKAESMTEFREYTSLVVNYYFADRCEKPTKFISKVTCQEALDEVNSPFPPEPGPTTTVQPSTSPEPAPTTTVQPSTSPKPVPTTTFGDDDVTSNTTGIVRTTKAFSGSFWEKLHIEPKEHKATMSEVSCIVECQSRSKTFADFDKDTTICTCYNSEPRTKKNVWKRIE